MDWYLNFEWQNSSSIDEDALDELMSRLADFSPAFAKSRDILRTSIVLDAPDAESAITIALRHLRSALSAAKVETVLSHISADTDERIAGLLREPSIPRLVGITEIAKYLGVSRQRASELARSDAFPRAVTRLASGPVWLEASMARFASHWKRVPGRRPTRRSA